MMKSFYAIIKVNREYNWSINKVIIKLKSILELLSNPETVISAHDRVT